MSFVINFINLKRFILPSKFSLLVTLLFLFASEIMYIKKELNKALLLTH